MSFSFILILSWQVSQAVCSRSKICVWQYRYYYGAKLERCLTNVAQRVYALTEIVHKIGKKMT